MLLLFLFLKTKQLYWVPNYCVRIASSSLVPGCNPTIDNTLNLSSVGCYGVISTPKIGYPWKVLRALTMEGYLIPKQKKKSYHGF